MPLQPLDLVLLEQELDAAGEAFDGIQALGVHGWEVELGRDLDAHLGHRAAGRRLEIFGGVEQRLRRDAADVEAGAAQRLAALGARRLQAQLRGTDGGDIAAGAGADHQDVEIVTVRSHSYLVPRRRPGSSQTKKRRESAAWAPAFAGEQVRDRSTTASGPRSL